MSPRRRRRLLRVCLQLPTWGLVFACATVARAEPSITAGLWTASPLRSDWNIGDWGTACGPRPSGGNEAGGTVTIAIQGNELTLNGLGRSFATTAVLGAISRPFAGQSLEWAGELANRLQDVGRRCAAGHA